MSYSYSKQFGVQSYVAGVNYSDWMKEALNPENKSGENKRLSITSSQEDYFKKQRLIQEAIAQLQRQGSVDAKIAKEVDVESLKKSLKNNSHLLHKTAHQIVLNMNKTFYTSFLRKSILDETLIPYF